MSSGSGDIDVFCPQQTSRGNSGVATYTRFSIVVPAKAEEGLSLASRSNAQAKPPLELSERVVKPESYPDSLVVIVVDGEDVVIDKDDGTITTAQVPIASTTAVYEQAGPSTLTSYPPQATTQPPLGERAVSPISDISTPYLPLRASEPSNAIHFRSKRRCVSPSTFFVKASRRQSSKEPVKRLEPGQSKLSTFLSQPGSSGSASKAKEKGKEQSPSKTAPSQSAVQDVDRDENEDIDMLLEESNAHENTEDVDYRLALELSSSQVSLPSPSSSQKQKEAGDTRNVAYGAYTTPALYEVAKEFTVNKTGVNKGKRSFVYSRPVGRGYDKGRAERLREDVDPQCKCNFYRWSSDARREMRQER
ncbi:Class II abasic (AP) endonuclease [Marasmius sp. AFHP31]|nr:Class II abasic (AP) endonuclease [Marasmius sp. AFHP31]